MREIQQNISKKKKEVNTSCARCQAGVAGHYVCCILAHQLHVALAAAAPPGICGFSPAAKSKY